MNRQPLTSRTGKDLRFGQRQSHVNNTNNHYPSGDDKGNRYVSTMSAARGGPSQKNSVVVRSKLGDLLLTGTDHQLQSLGGSVRSHQYGPNYRVDNDHRNFKVGDIIRTPWHAPNLNERSVFDGAETAYSSITGPICAKMRPAIIIAKFESHAVTVPVFSHGGRGPSHEASKLGCLALRNQDSIASSEDIRLNLVSIDFRSSKNSVVYLCKPVALEWASPIERLGKLDDRSLKSMTRTFTTFLGIGVLSIREQNEAFARYESRQPSGPGSVMSSRLDAEKRKRAASIPDPKSSRLPSIREGVSYSQMARRQ
ncbi:MAG: hypothetical protein M1828_005817 [Chrysothrix sp. TS-e1954]|nr:MAG: hypothetical protein M1828_005817 [Chrysothrix sp. TS-e1954]